MAVPSTRQEFIDYCLRKLGYPVIEINVDPDQIEDRVDESIRMYWDYHFDGSEKTYYKYQVIGNERIGAAKSITIANGGANYSNSDTFTISDGSGAVGTIVTNGSGEITAMPLTEYGLHYTNTSTISITTSTGSGANVSLVAGDGSITLPDNIIGAVSVFPQGNPALSSDDIFNIRYQIALNDLYTLTSVSLVPYYMVMEHIALIQELIVGRQPIRYSRHKNKLYIDTTWNNYKAGSYLLIEAYEVVDPAVYSEVWSDRWLQNYATAKIKYQWGSNLSKFMGMTLPGGVQFNGPRIADEAAAEIERMEREMISSYSIPPIDLIG